MATRKHSHLTKYNPIEHLVAFCRYKKILKYVRNEIALLDVGCGFNGDLLYYLSNKIKSGFGLDLSVNSEKNGNKIKLITWDLNSKTFPELPLFDAVTCLAVAEHVDNPHDLIKNIYDSLKNDGVLLLTAPTWKAKPVVEFAAFKFKIISKEEIIDHKRYFNKEEIVSLCRNAGFNDIEHSYFQFGLNNLVVARKNK